MSYWMIALIRKDNKSVLEITETETQDLNKLEINPMTLQFFFLDRDSCTEEEIRGKLSHLDEEKGLAAGWSFDDFPLYYYGKVTFYKKSTFVYNGAAAMFSAIYPNIPSIVVPD